MNLEKYRKELISRLNDESLGMRVTVFDPTAYYDVHEQEDYDLSVSSLPLVCDMAKAGYYDVYRLCEFIYQESGGYFSCFSDEDGTAKVIPASRIPIEQLQEFCKLARINTHYIPPESKVWAWFYFMLVAMCLAVLGLSYFLNT